jgi:hypothetical protein
MHDETDRPLTDENGSPLTEEELALAREGESLIAAAVADVQAPLSLREAIERDRERARGRAPFWRRHWRGLTAAAGAAAAVAAVAIALEAGSDHSAPSLARVDAAAQLSATESAPAALGGTPPVLDAKVDGLVFPDWRKSFGWQAVGRRDDSLSGRAVTTVFYRNPDGARLGYAVVAGDPLGDRPPGQMVTREGKTYHVARADERTIVTWTQQGHTCVIVAPSAVPPSRLVDLAASRNV